MAPSQIYLAAASVYFLGQGALFTLAPHIPAADSFGKDVAKSNKPLLVMHEVIGTVFAIPGVIAAFAAWGADIDTAFHAAMHLVPIRMAYDYFIGGTKPPVPAMLLTGSIMGFGFWKVALAHNLWRDEKKKEDSE